MAKLKSVYSPLRLAKAAKASVSTRWKIWKFGSYGEHRFKDDARFNLQNVTEGFRSRLDTSTDDTELLQRICAAYSRAIQQERLAAKAYTAPEQWQKLRQSSLGPVIRALLASDLKTLQKMYRNFYRDTCSSGLLGAPNGMSKEYFGGPIRDIYRRFYLSHVLCRFDYWEEMTDHRFTLRELAGPGVGNPFGVVIDGTHIGVGSEYAHYCAQRIIGLRPMAGSKIAEIGAGFGGMAYYLLRDLPKASYIGFDLPENIALTTYYLMKAFPQLNFALYGEQDITGALAQANVVLLPVFELANMPAESVNITFSCRPLSDGSQYGVGEYLTHTARMTKDHFLYIDKQRNADFVAETLGRNHPSLKLVEIRNSGWLSHKVSGAGVGGAAGLADSIVLERWYTQSSKTDTLDK